MNRKTALSLALTAVWFFVLGQAGARAGGTHRSLKVSLKYTGTQTVDASHRIYVLIFDANPYTASSLIDSTSDAAPPAPAEGVSHILQRLSAPRADGAVTFKNLAASTVYLMAFVDKEGTYDGHSDPPHGAPMGVHGKALDKLEAVSLPIGKTGHVVLAFDDSILTP